MRGMQNDPIVATRTRPQQWHLNHPRTRLVVLHLWDGRCGHCAKPLLSAGVDEYETASFDELPFQVDHIEPQSLGGPDTITNYIASCDRCNHRRSNRPITDRATWGKIAIVRTLIGSDEFPGYVAMVSKMERAIVDRAYFSMVRCFEHQWHVHGSPFQQACFAFCQKHFPGDLGTEWWSRFGSLSNYVRHIVGENLHIRGIVRGYDWWRQPEGWQLMLPRYCHTPFDIASVLDSVDSLGDRPPTEPAPMWCFGASHNLSPSNQRRALALSTTISVEETMNLDCFVDSGLTSKALLRLWRQKRWGDRLLFQYRAAVLILQAPGNLRKNLYKLSTLESEREAEDFLMRIESEGLAAG